MEDLKRIYGELWLILPPKIWKRMILQRISILNYKNILQAEITFSPKMNCFIGLNGAGKTNMLDAVYYLSFCKSATNPIDSQVISHGEEFFMLQGFYEMEDSSIEEIYCGMKRGRKKQFKRNKKEYSRLADHIGFIPLVIVSPSDSILIVGGSEERRRFMDVVISQYNRSYLDALVRYNKALQQRNVLLKAEEEPDAALMEIWEEMMAEAGEIIFTARQEFIHEFIPIFRRFYSVISQDNEEVDLLYTSHAQRGELRDVIRNSRMKDRIVGYSLHGIHKDELEMRLGDFLIKREGSQGQNKTYLIALKLAQFDFLRRVGSHTTPLLLLDDIFDKLDASRVEQIIKLVSGDNFGQIFVTDTNRDHLDNILCRMNQSYKLFEVANGTLHEREMKDGGIDL